MQSFTDTLPSLDNITAQRGESLGEKFSKVMVECLTSPKSEIRSAAESLLHDCIKNGVISMNTMRKNIGRLVPAKQRTVSPILARLSNLSLDEKETPKNETPAESSAEQAPPKADAILSSARNQKPSALPRKPVEENQSRRVVHQVEVESKGVKSVLHPLVTNSGSVGIQKSRAALRSMTWPEYPEEPTGSAILSGLKKAWSPLIPAESAKALFPDGGVKKQDDAMVGCELLSRAIVMERSGEGCAVIEQLELILKWTVLVLCSKESPVGLQSLLSLFAELFDFLRESKYEMSDSEAMLIVPILLENASAAKVRFLRPLVCIA
jgi:hypothetical protein